MPRFALLIDYDGAPFHGWQRQKEDLSSVQSCIETALSRLEPGPHKIHGAGRTDRGVHALGQVASVDLARDWDPFRLMEALNFYMKPLPVAIISLARVADDFHARFSAIERHYVFRLVTRRAPMTHDEGRVWHMRHNLDLSAMQDGARHLVGLHDFTTFRATMCQAKSPVKALDGLDVQAHEYHGGTEYRFSLRSRSFLHNQVRSIVGTLERVGAGAWPPARVREALEAKDRRACGPVCPPHGLYLYAVRYSYDPFALRR